MSNIGFHKAMDALALCGDNLGRRSIRVGRLAAGGFSVGGGRADTSSMRSPTGDGLLAGRAAQFVHDSRRPLAELADAVITYPQVLVNVKVRNRHPDVANELAAEIAVAGVVGWRGQVS